MGIDSFTGSLPRVSKVVSDTINEMQDALSQCLDTMTHDELDELLPIFRSHLPKTIAEISFDRIYERVPKQYVKNAIASSLASRIVYKEGTKFVSSFPPEQIAQFALRYIEKEKEVEKLHEVLHEANLPEAEKTAILKLLKEGGARTLLQESK